MSDRSTVTILGRWLLRVVVLVLALHFVFGLVLANRVSPPAALAFLIALALALPIARQLPFLGRPGVRGACLILLLLAANVWLSSGDREDLQRQAMAFVGATILTGQLDAAPIANGVVLVDADGRISRVGDSSVQVPAGHELLDLTGKYLVPGLINAHGHLMLNGGVPGEKAALPAILSTPWLANAVFAFLQTYPGKRVVLEMMERHVQLALRSGVTTLRGLGDPLFLDVELRDRIAAGRLLGPRLLVAGPILAITGGHAHQIGQVFDGADGARRAVRLNLSRQVDLIKIASTGGVSDSRRLGEAGELQMTPEELAAIVDEAHRKNVLVTAHAESAQGVLEVLEAGVDNVEHGAELSARALALFRNNPKSLRGYTTLHPTLSVVARARELPEAAEGNRILQIMTINGNEIRRRMIRGFQQAHEGGVKIGVGTDAGIVDHGSVWMEMTFFEEFGGISRARAIHLATLGTAESIGVAEITGSIEAGKYADLVVLDRDPLEDLAAFSAPSLVVARGYRVPAE